MAVIEGATTAALSEVDAVSKGLRIANVPKDVVGAYGCTAVTGVLPAALAVGSVLWGARNGPSSTRRMIITRLFCRLYVRTVASAFTDVNIELIRYSAANFSGGTAATIFSKRPNGIATVTSASLAGGTEGGDNRIATTAGLTTTGVTFDTSSSYSMLYVPVISVTSPAAGAMFERPIENDAGLEHPVELLPGEGVCFRTSTVFPAGFSAVAQLGISWSERT